MSEWLIRDRVDPAGSKSGHVRYALSKAKVISEHTPRIDGAALDVSTP
jgi:hypothetical protein